MVESGKRLGGRLRRAVTGAARAATERVTSTSGQQPGPDKPRPAEPAAPAAAAAAVKKTPPKKETPSKKTVVGKATASTAKVSVRGASAKKTTVDKITALALGDLRVRPGESPWTADELSAVRDELQADVVRLRTEIATAEDDLAGLLRDPGDGAGDDQADAGTKAFEREHEMALANNSRDMLSQAERAMRRIGDGTYGICEICGSPIGKARLQVFPRATLCVTCKQREERR